jgi:8-oxo-dGTP pyrophosphatase MutT (NUDIX family)
MSRRFELVEMLEAYVPPPARVRARDETLLLAQSPGDAFSRYVYDPGHVTASGFVVSPDDSAVLLVHHRRLQRWVQPGGHVDPTGERVVEAARREVVEETGVGGLTLAEPGIFDVDVHDVPAGKGEPRHKHFDVRFLFRTDAWDLAAAADEVGDAVWVPFAQVADLTDERSVLLPVKMLASTLIDPDR